MKSLTDYTIVRFFIVIGTIIWVSSPVLYLGFMSSFYLEFFNQHKFIYLSYVLVTALCMVSSLIWVELREEEVIEEYLEKEKQKQEK